MKLFKIGWRAMFKEDFPLLNSQVCYLDSAASAQKPESVLRCMDQFYRMTYANVHRGQCTIAVRATDLYEQSRHTIADFIHTGPKNIIFTKGTTESINLVASGYREILKPGDEVLVSMAEHHADFVPWQQVCRRTGATFKVFNVLPDGQLDLNDFRLKLSPKTKLVAVTQLSNVLGIVNPVRKMADLSHQFGARILVDGAQGIAHLPVDVTELDCDYYAFSGHKLYGPTGIGVLYGKTEALEQLPPYQFGGDMIKTVSVEETEMADIPARFEAGTTPFVEAVGLAEAVRYISHIGMHSVCEHERKLTDLLLDELHKIPNMEILGDCSEKQGLVSFNIKGIHPADLAFILSKEHICVRVGHHCAMPIHHFFNRDVSLRVSFGLYNDQVDIDILMKSLKKALSLLGEG